MLEHMTPTLLTKAFLIMAFIGAFTTSVRMHRNGDDYVLVFVGLIWGAVAGAIVLATLIAIVEALVFLFT